MRPTHAPHATPKLTLCACALAAALFLSACGGGSSTDTTPPSVTISAAVGTGSTVTFTFNFSEDVGSSFIADDVSVTGGTKAASVTKVSSTQYTLVVTPDASATTVTATVATGKFSDTSSNANTAAATVTCTVAPTTAAATPTPAAANVVSIYSDTYTQSTGVNMNPDWGQAGIATNVDTTIAGNTTRKLTNFNFQGIDFTANIIDLSTKDTLHIDIWRPDATELAVYLIDNNSVEKYVTVTPTVSAWKSVDIALSSFSSQGVDLTKIKQIKLVNGGATQVAGGTLYFDNLYFYKATSPSASCTAGSTCTIDFSGSSTGLSGFEGLVSATKEADPTNSSNIVGKLIKGPDGKPYAGATIYTTDATTATVGNIDLVTNPVVTMKVYSPAVGKNITMKLEVVGGAGAEVVAKSTVANAWETLSFNYTGKFTSAQVPNRISVFPEWGGGETTAPASNVTYYIDDVKFTQGTTAAGCSTVAGKAALTSGKFASGYTGSLTAGYSTECGSIAVYTDSTQTKVYYDGGVAGSAGDPNFWFGYGYAPTAITSAAYIGANVKAPNNGIADMTGYTKVAITTWTWDDQTNQGATGTVSLIGPDVSGCTPKITKPITMSLPLGAKTFTLNFTDFTLANACGYASVSAMLAAGISMVDVQYVGTTGLNHTLNPFTGTGSNNGYYGSGMNLGKITFQP